LILYSKRLAPGADDRLGFAREAGADRFGQTSHVHYRGADEAEKKQHPELGRCQRAQRRHRRGGLGGTGKRGAGDGANRFYIVCTLPLYQVKVG